MLEGRPLIRYLRRTSSLPAEPIMLGTGGLTFLFGLILLWPDETFPTSTVYALMGRFFGEEAWGVILLSLGAAMLTAWYFWCAGQEISAILARAFAAHPDVDLPALADFASTSFATVVWSIGAAVWFIVSLSFLFSNPLSPGFVTFAIAGFGSSVFSALSIWRNSGRRERDARRAARDTAREGAGG